MTKRKKILILFLFLGLVLIFLICTIFHIPCLFKTVFHIPCPACGIGRAIKLILKFKFIESFSYSILAQPTLLILLIILLIDIYDLIKNKDNLTIFLNKIINNYHFIIIYLLLSWFINIINGI